MYRFPDDRGMSSATSLRSFQVNVDEQFFWPCVGKLFVGSALTCEQAGSLPFERVAADVIS